MAALWGCLALFCPATWAPVASGCFLGSLLAVLLVWLLPSAARQQIAESSRAPSSSRIVLSSTRTAISVLLLVLVLTAAAIAQGAPAPPPAVPPPSEAPADKVYRVLFPVDDEQQPAEPYVYVPRDFCNRLRREASGGGVVSRQWLIAGAGYRVVFDRDAADPAPLARELVALYRVRTSRAGVRLVLPIRQDQVYLLPNRARLDGRPASVAWESEGPLLVVEIPEAGEADLELAFRPQVERRDGPAALRSADSPRAECRDCDCSCPTTSRTSIARRVLGPTTTEATGERVLALGPADRLVLQWPTAAAATAGPPAVESEQLLWLRIRPGAVVLQAKVRFQSAGGRLPEVALLASPRLRLLPHRGVGPGPRDSTTRGRGPAHPLAAEIAPSTQEVTLDLEFVLADTSGIGSVRIPRLEAIADRTTRRWLGVSVDEALSYEVPAEGRGEAVDAAAFAAAWEAGTVPPQLAVVVPDGEPAWSLSTRPSEVKLKAAQQLNVAWGANARICNSKRSWKPPGAACSSIVWTCRPGWKSAACRCASARMRAGGLVASGQEARLAVRCGPAHLRHAPAGIAGLAAGSPRSAN